MKPHTLSILGAGLFALGAAAQAHAGEGLSAGQAHKAMAEHDGEVRGCYMKHAFKQQSASGKVTVDLVVDKDGTVSHVKVAAPGVRGKTFDRCVAHEARSWQFPSSDAATEIEFPFLFQHTHARGAGPAHSRHR